MLSGLVRIPLKRLRAKTFLKTLSICSPPHLRLKALAPSSHPSSSSEDCNLPTPFAYTLSHTPPPALLYFRSLLPRSPTFRKRNTSDTTHRGTPHHLSILSAILPGTSLRVRSFPRLPSLSARPIPDPYILPFQDVPTPRPTPPPLQGPRFCSAPIPPAIRAPSMHFVLPHKHLRLHLPLILK